MLCKFATEHNAYSVQRGSPGTPIPTNTRRAAKALFDQKPGEKPWFGIEQESRARPFGRALVPVRLLSHFPMEIRRNE